MKFRTKYDRNAVFAEPGSPVRTVYGAKYDNKHNLVVEKKAEENFYAYINSFADSVDINVLVTRFTNGDREALLQRAGAYIDVSSMPTNLNDFISLSQSATALFDTLPVEVKSKFDNNVMEFVSMVGTKEWNDIMDTSQAAERKKVSDKKKEAAEIMQQSIKPNSVYGDQPADPVPTTPVEDEPKSGIFLKGDK